MSSPRYPWIDHLKFLAICLVAAGHTALSAGAHHWIYAFHMPLFFMISGFLISRGGFSGGLWNFFKRRVSKLVVLYLAFGLLGMAVYCYLFRHEQPLSEMLRGRIRSLLFASASRDRPEDLYPLVLWFFPALISGLLLTFAAWKIPSAWGKTGAVMGVFAVGALLTGQVLPWELESGCLAAGFIAAGHGLRVAGWDGLLQKAGRRSLPFAVAAVGLGSYLALRNHPGLDLRTATLGNPLLSLTAAPLLIGGLAALAMHLPTLKFTAVVAAATILIFPIHTMIFPFVDRAAHKLPLLQAAVESHAGWYEWSKALLVVVGIGLVHFCYVRAKSGRVKPRNL